MCEVVVQSTRELSDPCKLPRFPFAPARTTMFSRPGCKLVELRKVKPKLYVRVHDGSVVFAISATECCVHSTFMAVIV